MKKALKMTAGPNALFEKIPVLARDAHLLFQSLRSSPHFPLKRGNNPQNLPYKRLESSKDLALDGRVFGAGGGI